MNKNMLNNRPRNENKYKALETCERVVFHKTQQKYLQE